MYSIYKIKNNINDKVYIGQHRKQEYDNAYYGSGQLIKQAIIDAGAVRTTPILLTTGAVVIGAIIILFDPIFQGLAISLVFGAIVSTLLTLIVVPLIYYMSEKKKWEKIHAENNSEFNENDSEIKSNEL